MVTSLISHPEKVMVQILEVISW